MNLDGDVYHCVHLAQEASRANSEGSHQTFAVNFCGDVFPGLESCMSNMQAALCTDVTALRPV